MILLTLCFHFHFFFFVICKLYNEILLIWCVDFLIQFHDRDRGKTIINNDRVSLFKKRLPNTRVMDQLYTFGKLCWIISQKNQIVTQSIYSYNKYRFSIFIPNMKILYLY